MSQNLLLTSQERADAGKVATRAAYGETLCELVREGYDVIAVDADLSGSTTSKKLAEIDARRFVNVGIAEANMVGVASGLSLAGKIAYTGSFAVFGTGRAYDQIRNTVCYGNLNVKIAPTHSGVTVGPDGGSHQMLEDINLMRGLPNMRVLVPADYRAAKTAIRIAAQEPGPVYVRLGRAKVPVIYREDAPFGLGGANVVRQGDDITFVTCGIEVSFALEAAEILAQRGVSAEVIDAYCVKPLDAQAILASAHKTGKVVTAEEHSIIGGLGSAVAELLGEQSPLPMVRVGVLDEFGTSGDIDELLAAYKLDTAALLEAAEQLL